MNTTALKTFAPAVRKQIMEAVTRKLDFALTAQTPDYLTTFAPQVAALRELAQADRALLIECVAYTWFNRLGALRFMDARNWHPFRAGVLTPATAAETQLAYDSGRIAGIKYASAEHAGGINVVVFPDRLAIAAGNYLEVYDPHGHFAQRLP